MAQRKRTIRRLSLARPADFDEQLWPINCAILILAGFVAGLVIAKSSFDDPRLLYNGWTQLFSVAVMVVLLFLGVMWLQGKMLRRLQLAVVLSLVAHLALITYLTYEHLALNYRDDLKSRSQVTEPQERKVANEYHWTQIELPPDEESPYERPVETEAPKDEVTPVERPDVEREVPVEAKPAPVPEPKKAPEPTPVEIRQAQLSAPRRSEQAAGGQLRRQEVQFRAQIGDPTPEPAAAERQPAAGTLDAPAATAQRQDPPGVTPERRAVQEPQSPRQPDVLRLARNGSQPRPDPQPSATPAPQRQIVRAAEVPRTEATGPQPAQPVQSPEATPLKPGAADVARQPAETPKGAVQPTAPAAAELAMANVERAAMTPRAAEKRPEMSAAPQSLTERRTPAVAAPAETVEQQAVAAAASANKTELAAAPAPVNRQPATAPRPGTTAAPSAEPAPATVASLSAPNAVRRTEQATPAARPSNTAAATPRQTNPAARISAEDNPTIAQNVASQQPKLAAAEPGSTAVSKAAAGPPRSVAQPAAAGEALTALTSAPQLPSAAAKRSAAAQQQPGNADRPPSQPMSLAHAPRGISVPSAVLPTEGSPETAPAAAGSSAGSRIDVTSAAAAVERSAAKAPAGNTAAAAGTAAFAVGAGQVEVRQGQVRGTGLGEPSVAANVPAARLARSTSTAPGNAVPLADIAPQVSVPADASAGGPPSLAVNAKAAVAARNGRPVLPSVRPAPGSGPVGTSGTPDRIGLAMPDRITRDESTASGAVTGGGAEQPSRTNVGQALTADLKADAPEIVMASPGGGSTAGSPLEARRTGTQRQRAALPGRQQREAAAGAPAALGDQGRPLSVAQGRRATAAQNRDAAAGVQPDFSATVKRSDRGNNVPAAADVVETLSVPGAGGVSPNAGGAPSTLDAGAFAAIEKSAAKLPGGRQTAPGGAADFAVGTASVATLGGPVRAGAKSVPVVAVETAGSPVGRTFSAASPVGAVVAGVPESAAASAQGAAAGTPAGPTVEATATAVDRRNGAGLPDVGAPRSGELAAPAGDPARPAAAHLGRSERNDAAPSATGGPSAAGPARQTMRAPAALALADASVVAAGAAAGAAGEGGNILPDAAATAARRGSAGLPGTLNRQPEVDGATVTGPTAATPGIAAGPRRLPQGPDRGLPLAAAVGSGPLGRTNAPGLPRGLTETVEPQPAEASAAAQPGSAADLTVGSGAGELGRQAGGLSVRVAALPGPSGLGPEPSVSVGIPNRRARPESEVVHPVPRRFLVARSGAEMAIDGAVNEPTESFAQREPARRAQAARAQGGAGGNEIAVENGLDFFARTQFPDGRWSLHEMPPAFVQGIVESKGEVANLAAEARKLLDAAAPRSVGDDLRASLEATLRKQRTGRNLSRAEVQELLRFVLGLGEMHADTAATGLALLTYLGAGYTHLDDKHRTVVRRGVQWLVEHQKPDGELSGEGSKYTRFYSHGIAAIALCEAYGMTQDPELREPARKAIDFIIKTQHATRGGWRYEVDDQGRSTETDTSVTGWQLMALKSAQMAGLEVRPEVFDRIGQWLDAAQGPDKDGRYIYNPHADKSRTEQREGLKPSLAMTGEAMLMRMYLGAKRDDRKLVEGAEYLKANLPEMGAKERSSRDCYYWYYATQAMYHMQGDYWTAWNDRLLAMTVNSQVQKGDLTGSWHPAYPTPDRWGHAGGRLYVTAMHLLMLEVYYRHLPLFKDLRKE